MPSVFLLWQSTPLMVLPKMRYNVAWQTSTWLRRVVARFLLAMRFALAVQWFEYVGLAVCRHA